jgi:hypothetical protein
MLKDAAKLYYARNKHEESCNCQSVSQSVTQHGVARLIPSMLQIRIITYYFLVLYFDEELITNEKLATEI